MEQARFACEEFLTKNIPSLYLFPFDAKAQVDVKVALNPPSDLFSATYTISYNGVPWARFWQGVNPWRSVAVLFFPTTQRWWQAEYIVAAQHIFQLPKERGWRVRWMNYTHQKKSYVALVIESSTRLPMHFLNRESYRLEIGGTITAIVDNLLQLHKSQGMPLPQDEPFLFDDAQRPALPNEEG